MRGENQFCLGVWVIWVCRSSKLVQRVDCLHHSTQRSGVCGPPCHTQTEGKDLRGGAGLASGSPRPCLKVCFHMSLHIPLLRGRTQKFCSSRQASEIPEGKVSLPELTWESLKGRHPAAARRKRALWRGGKRHSFTIQDEGRPREGGLELR